MKVKVTRLTFCYKMRNYSSPPLKQTLDDCFSYACSKMRDHQTYDRNIHKRKDCSCELIRFVNSTDK